MDLRIFTEPQQGASYDDQLRVATTAEAAGYDAYFRSEYGDKSGWVEEISAPERLAFWWALI